MRLNAQHQEISVRSYSYIARGDPVFDDRSATPRLLIGGSVQERDNCRSSLSKLIVMKLGVKGLIELCI